MRRYYVVGVVLAAGCLGPERPTEFWAEQIDRTSAIPNPNVRASTLEKIAESAAYGGDAVAARYALERLGNGRQRDEVVARCVDHLAGRDPAAARSLAREIDNRDRRGQVLAKLDEKSQDKAPRADAITAASATDPGRPADGR
jgi:hypothetical protein